MLHVFDVLKSENSVHQETLVVVSGVLFVSKEIVILCESETNTSQGILINAEGLNNLLVKKVPAYGGGFISFVGEAAVTGYISSVGLKAIPYRMHGVSNIVFKSHHGIEVEYQKQHS